MSEKGLSSVCFRVQPGGVSGDIGISRSISKPFINAIPFVYRARNYL